jgi:hypothetical protein
MAKSVSKYCIKCKIKLTAHNTHPSHIRRRFYICKICDNSAHKNKRISIKEEVFKQYGGKCKCCGEDNIIFLTIDHISNDGAKHRKNIASNMIYNWLKKHGFPKDNYQILCFNCNFAKQFGECPHKSRKQ